MAPGQLGLDDVFLDTVSSHGSHNQQPFDLQKRSILDEPLGFNDSLVSLPHGLVSRAADDALWAKKVRSGKW
jgi:hypothetical protein